MVHVMMAHVKNKFELNQNWLSSLVFIGFGF